MQVCKVFIADPSEEFRQALTDSLCPGFQVETCGDGAAALERIRQWEPEIVVSELLLENMDGIELLQQLAQLPKPPRVMVVTRMSSQFVQAVLEQLSVQYAMVKPCRPDTAARRVREIAQTISSDSPNSQLTGLLMELGLPNGRQGFGYLLTAIPLLMLQRDRRLSKELYEEVATAHNSTPIRVEKAIRDTLRSGWSGGHRDAWQRYFPDAVRCPRNKDFLFRVTDILLHKQNQHLRSEPSVQFIA